MNFGRRRGEQRPARRCGIGGAFLQRRARRKASARPAQRMKRRDRSLEYGSRAGFRTPRGGSSLLRKKIRCFHGVRRWRRCACPQSVMRGGHARSRDADRKPRLEMDRLQGFSHADLWSRPICARRYASTPRRPASGRIGVVLRRAAAATAQARSRRRRISHSSGSLRGRSALSGERAEGTAPHHPLYASMPTTCGSSTRGAFPRRSILHLPARCVRASLRGRRALRSRMMSVGLHCRLAGRPGRAAGLKRFLDHIGKFDPGADADAAASRGSGINDRGASAAAPSRHLTSSCDGASRSRWTISNRTGSGRVCRHARRRLRRICLDRRGGV